MGLENQALEPDPKTQDQAPSTLHPTPKTPDPKIQDQDPKTIDPRPPRPKAQTHDPRPSTQHPRLKPQDRVPSIKHTVCGSWVWVLGVGVLGFGSWVLDSGCWMPVLGSRFLGSWGFVVPGSWRLVFGSWGLSKSFRNRKNFLRQVFVIKC